MSELLREASGAGNALGLPWDLRRGAEPLAGFPLLPSDPIQPPTTSLRPVGATGSCHGYRSRICLARAAPNAGGGEVTAPGQGGAAGGEVGRRLWAVQGGDVGFKTGFIPRRINLPSLSQSQPSLAVLSRCHGWRGGSGLGHGGDKEVAVRGSARAGSGPAGQSGARGSSVAAGRTLPHAVPWRSDGARVAGATPEWPSPARWAALGSGHVPGCHGEQSSPRSRLRRGLVAFGRCLLGYLQLRLAIVKSRGGCRGAVESCGMPVPALPAPGEHWDAILSGGC